MKKTTILLVFLSAACALQAQIRVFPNGRVGIGTNAPIEKLHVTGGLHLSEGSNSFRFLPSNSGYVEIGSSTGQIEFWYSSPVGHNTLKAKDFIRMSDRALKENIKPIKDGLQTVLRLQGVTYNLKNDGNQQASVQEYGFIAQDVEKEIKDITQTSKGCLGLDYDEIIPFLVEAIKEQQAIIEEMRAAGNYGSEKSTTRENGDEPATVTADEPRLFQNNPNPYKESTQIAYYLPENTGHAELMLFDLQGTLISTYPLQGKGSGTFVLNAGSHKAGMYHYTLVVNGEAVDTKKMILTK